MAQRKAVPVHDFLELIPFEPPARIWLPGGGRAEFLVAADCGPVWTGSIRPAGTAQRREDGEPQELRGFFRMDQAPCADGVAELHRAVERIGARAGFDVEEFTVRSQVTEGEPGQEMHCVTAVVRARRHLQDSAAAPLTDVVHQDGAPEHHGVVLEYRRFATGDWSGLVRWDDGTESMEDVRTLIVAGQTRMPLSLKPGQAVPR
ncbi:hypothetical protein LN042_22995 [Kitasatospora sp. RB6PN24]|uniref:hypothetical protein n=1 Tax=Kitasatospora humi TaxID=2893891 RepID=UPI001E50A686|nr:hypothetical protein [Kitasatospora humi]MCC9309903.1 hypothetical protein [Kitasatospora humi]